MKEQISEKSPSNIDVFSTGLYPTWCPGCGNYGTFAALKKALTKLNLNPHEIVFTYGIGCHGHMVNFLNTYGFEGLHGRPLPLAQGVKLANHDLTVIASTGDGDCLGEGGNHFIHAARRNINIKVIIHDNQSYSLTTGQTSPTSEKNYLSKSTPFGNLDIPINPVSLALASHASFVARGFSGDTNHLAELFKAAISHPGFAVVDVLQPCVIFNKVNTFEFFQKRIEKIEPRQTFNEAFKKATQWPSGPDAESTQDTKIPIGIFYAKPRSTLESQLPQLAQSALAKKGITDRDLASLLEKFR
ncbi:MAG: 2-oxoacid:ferredoxin oxidoreductase subunit beta [Candidatus Cloacimonetes bacterium]|nr:2-oxoacid:ferredoxin oxidoreductase subunit beta [Candidatus Cloacimonadota bacterium]